MSEQIIGIVGGAGPYAGLDLQRKILAQTVAREDQDHLPVISLSQPSQIPDRTEYLLGETAVNPAHAIADQLIRLADAGATVAAIPCNTAHAPRIFDQVLAELEDAACSIRFLHMIAETADFLQRRHPQLQQVGVLSTTGTYRARLYPDLLAARGFTVLVPEPDFQETVIHPAIYHPDYGIKATGSATDRARADLLRGARRLGARGAEALILGCTEIPLALTERRLYNMVVVDPTLVLARALICAVAPEQLRSLS